MPPCRLSEQLFLTTDRTSHFFNLPALHAVQRLILQDGFPSSSSPPPWVSAASLIISISGGHLPDVFLDLWWLPPSSACTLSGCWTSCTVRSFLVLISVASTCSFGPGHDASRVSDDWPG